MAKKVALEVGQKVWLEKIYKYGDRTPSLCEMTVVEANKTSAYITDDPNSKLKYRVTQRNHEVSMSVLTGYKYTLWLSKEAHDNYYSELANRSQLYQEALKKLNRMSTEELKLFLNE